MNGRQLDISCITIRTFLWYTVAFSNLGGYGIKAATQLLLFTRSPQNNKHYQYIIYQSATTQTMTTPPFLDISNSFYTYPRSRPISCTKPTKNLSPPHTTFNSNPTKLFGMSTIDQFITVGSPRIIALALATLFRAPRQLPLSTSTSRLFRRTHRPVWTH